MAQKNNEDSYDNDPTVGEAYDEGELDEYYCSASPTAINRYCPASPAADEPYNPPSPTANETPYTEAPSGKAWCEPRTPPVKKEEECDKPLQPLTPDVSEVDSTDDGFFYDDKCNIYYFHGMEYLVRIINRHDGRVNIYLRSHSSIKDHLFWVSRTRFVKKMAIYVPAQVYPVYQSNSSSSPCDMDIS